MAEQNPTLISYLVQVHFVLKSWDENKYESVYADMAKAGLHRQHTNGSGLRDTLPKGVVIAGGGGDNAAVAVIEEAGGYPVETNVELVRS